MTNDEISALENLLKDNYFGLRALVILSSFVIYAWTPNKSGAEVLTTLLREVPDPRNLSPGFVRVHNSAEPEPNK